MNIQANDAKLEHKPICEKHINQIKVLAKNSESASAYSLKSNQILIDSVNSLSLFSNKTPEIINRIKTLLTHAQILSLDLQTTSIQARRTDIELSEITNEIDISFNQIIEELNLLTQTSNSINKGVSDCTQMIKKSTEFIEITELSAQFISHFASTDTPY